MESLLKALSAFLSPYLPFTLPTTSDIESHTQIHHTMNYPNTAPLDLSAFSRWPDALTASEEEIAMWAQLGKYTQPGPDEDGIPLDILDATLAWGSSRTTPTEFNFEDNLVGIFAFGT